MEESKIVVFRSAKERSFAGCYRRSLWVASVLCTLDGESKPSPVAPGEGLVGVGDVGCGFGAGIGETRVMDSAERVPSIFARAEYIPRCLAGATLSIISHDLSPSSRRAASQGMPDTCC